MKKYKLLKDMPTVKAGAIFHRKTNETMQVDMLKRVDDQGIFLPPSLDVSDISDFDEWFEEIKQLTINDIDWNFDPKPGDVCYFIGDTGTVSCYTHDEIYRKDDLALGIRFKTAEEAKAYRKWLKAVAELRRSSNFKPNWKDRDQDKYYVNYCEKYKELSTTFSNTWDNGAPVYYEKKEDAKQSIKDHKEAWLTYFGVKED